jgi:hypothetical protein
MENFDPNIQQRPWGLFVQGRTPNFKVYKTRGHALSAAAGNWILYEHDGSKWVEIVRRDGRDTSPTCECCGGSFPNYTMPEAYHQLVRVSRRGPFVEPLVVATICRDCRA